MNHHTLCFTFHVVSLELTWHFNFKLFQRRQHRNIILVSSQCLIQFNQLFQNATHGFDMQRISKCICHTNSPTNLQIAIKQINCLSKISSKFRCNGCGNFSRTLSYRTLTKKQATFHQIICNMFFMRQHNQILIRLSY